MPCPIEATLLAAVRHEKARRLKRIAELRQQIEDQREQVMRLWQLEYELAPGDGVKVTIEYAADQKVQPAPEPSKGNG